VLVFPCYSVAAGAPVSGSSATRKVVAVVDATGAVNASTSSFSPYGGSYADAQYTFSLRSAATLNGSDIYVSAGGGYYASKGLDSRYIHLHGGVAGQTPAVVSGTLSSGQPGASPAVLTARRRRVVVRSPCVPMPTSPALSSPHPPQATTTAAA
jgi:hypothetical protein